MIIKALAALWLLSGARVETPRVEVRHDETLCLTYRASLEGDYLVVRAAIEPGWHTFAMDNERRAKKKLAGRKSLGIDRQTEITLSGGLAPAGAWRQSPPKDFSKPELRWFSWGFEREAVFAAKVRRTGGPGKIGIKGQACSDTTCKNIDIELPAPDPTVKAAGSVQTGLVDVKP